MRERLDNHDTKLDMLDNNVTVIQENFETEIVTLKDTTDNQQQALDDLGSETETIKEAMSQSDNDIEALKEDINTAKEEANNLTEQLTSISEATASSLPRLSRWVSSLCSTVTEVTSLSNSGTINDYRSSTQRRLYITELERIEDPICSEDGEAAAQALEAFMGAMAGVTGKR